MEERDRLKGLVFFDCDGFDPNAHIIWFNMKIRGEAEYCMYVRFDARDRSFNAVRSAHRAREKNFPRYFRNRRFIDAVVSKIPEDMIAMCIAHSIAFSARRR